MSRLWLLRHGPVDVPAGQCYGRTDVAALAPASRDIAARVAPTLAEGTALVVSPRARCVTLAREVLALRPDLASRVDPRIAEMDFGAWEGRPWSDIGRDEFDGWMADFAQARAGGHGERTADFMARVGAAYDDWRGAPRTTLWITHAGVMRAALLLAAGRRQVARADEWPVQAIGWGELLALPGGG